MSLCKWTQGSARMGRISRTTLMQRCWPSTYTLWMRWQLVPDPEGEQSSEIRRLISRSLVSRTDVLDIRLQRFSGELLRTPPETVQVTHKMPEPQFSRTAGTILVLFTNRLDYRVPPVDDEPAAPVGHVETSHIVELELSGDEEPTNDDIVDLIQGTTLFMVFPYVRAALHRLPTEFGLPPILLPYLRRDAIHLLVPRHEGGGAPTAAPIAAPAPPARKPRIVSQNS